MTPGKRLLTVENKKIWFFYIVKVNYSIFFFLPELYTLKKKNIIQLSSLKNPKYLNAIFICEILFYTICTTAGTIYGK